MEGKVEERKIIFNFKHPPLLMFRNVFVVGGERVHDHDPHPLWT